MHFYYYSQGLITHITHIKCRYFIASSRRCSGSYDQLRVYTKSCIIELHWFIDVRFEDVIPDNYLKKRLIRLCEKNLTHKEI